jgi:hypothetical protein
MSDHGRRVRVLPANFGIVWLHLDAGLTYGEEEVGTVGEWLHRSCRSLGTMELYYRKGGLLIFERIGLPMAEIWYNEPKLNIHH